jgi:tRNA (guanine6-N2)-methyltransferase
MKKMKIQKKITMKALAITHKGLEQVTSLEIDELLKTKTEIKDSCVIFDIKSYEDIALVCYKSQSTKKVIYLIDSFKINSVEDIKKYVEKNKQEIEQFIDKKTFAVKTEHLENDFDREEICIETAEPLTSKVDLNNPDVILFVYIYKDECYLGIDFSSDDLSKREYRIYTHFQALRASIAYSMLRIAEYKKEETILDPFCGSATIIIEAALFANNLSQNYYSKDKFLFNKLIKIDLNKFDKKSKFKLSSENEKGLQNSKNFGKGKIIGFDSELRYIIGAKKNAKIAGIEKSIDFSRVEIEWLETKLQENSIDKIITNPPNLSHKNEKIIEKLYNEFFYQAEFILKKDGTVTLITKTFDLIRQAAEKNKFKLIKEVDILIGKENHKIMVFEKVI